MTITLRIDYHALWGSELFVYTGEKVQSGGHVPPHAIALENDGHGHWFTEVQSEEYADVAYHYAIAHLGVIVACEWGNGHRIETVPLDSSNNCLRIWNTWISAPDNTEFHTLGFTQAIFRHPQPSLLPPPASDTLTFRIEAATIRPEHKLAIVGNIPELGEWDTSRAIVAEPDGLPFWRVTIDRTRLHYPIYYKFILIDASTGHFIEWENRPNRFFEPTAFYPGDMLVVDDLRFTNPLKPWHGVGVSIDLNHIRSAQGCAIGEFTDLLPIIDWAEQCGLKVVQLQPVNDCGEGSKDPYHVSSGFALDFRYICPQEAGQIEDQAFVDYYSHRREILASLPKVKLSDIKMIKAEYLCRLFEQEGAMLLESNEFAQFYDANQEWLEEYSQLIAQKNGEQENLVLRKVGFYQFVQFHLHRQLQQARDYARLHGILLMGTTPHGILKHSVDSVLYRKYYNLGLKESHSYLSKVRQQRNTRPTFNWFALEDSNYRLLSDRIKVLSQYFDACEPSGLLGMKQETSEFWHIIAEKALVQLKENTPILLYSLQANEKEEEAAWWEVQDSITRALQDQRRLISVLPFEKWIQLSDVKISTQNTIEEILANKQIKELIHTILITNKLLF